MPRAWQSVSMRKGLSAHPARIGLQKRMLNSLRKLFPVNRRPNRGVMVEQMDGVGYDERLPTRFDPVLIVALKFFAARGICVFDAPVRRLDDVDFLGELRCEFEHVFEHVGFYPVIGFENGDPFAVRFLEPSIAGCPVTLVLLVDDDDAAVVLRVTLHDLQESSVDPSLRQMISRFSCVWRRRCRALDRGRARHCRWARSPRRAREGRSCSYCRNRRSSTWFSCSMT